MKDFLDAKELKKAPTTFIKVTRRRFRLEVFTRAPSSSKFVKTFFCNIAIGAIGFETPRGVYLVLGKESPPTYTAPNSKWALDAGFKPGEKLPHDHPDNPLRGAFLWLNDEGIGIHGSPNLLSLRTKASHGCVRVRPEDAIWLYKNIPLATQVVIV